MSAKQSASVIQQYKIAKHHKELVRRYYREAWNSGKLAVINEIFAFNHIDHDSANPVVPPAIGVESIKEVVKAFRTALPDLNFTIEDMIAERDKVVVRYTICGTTKGKLASVPLTGRQVTLAGIIIHRLVNDKIMETWGNRETLITLQQSKHFPATVQSPFSYS
jgi:steroid delta-isomerase-like uncharacterized protein